MASLDYGDFALVAGRFIVEGVSYVHVPARVEDVSARNRVSSETALNLDRILVEVPDRVNVVWQTDNNLYPQVRDGVLSDLSFSWDDDYISAGMLDHLLTLHSLDKRFWLRYDDLLSYTAAEVVAVGDSGRVFMTPTWSVAFHREVYKDGDMLDERAYAEVLLDGVAANWETNPWRLDPFTGVLRFERAIDSSVEVTVHYVWQAYGRIKSVQFTPIGNIARNCYTGTLVFEQYCPPTEVPRVDDSLVDEATITVDDGLLTASNLGTDTPLTNLAPPHRYSEVEALVGTPSTQDDQIVQVVATATGFEINEDHYIHGIEISELVAGVPTPVVDGGIATVKVRTKLDDTGNTMSDWQQKIAQSAEEATDHAVEGLIDGTADDYSFGGQFDMFEKTAVQRPFGCFSPAQINEHGLGVELYFEETSAHGDAYDPANWSIAYVLDGYTWVKSQNDSTVLVPEATWGDKSITYSLTPPHNGVHAKSFGDVRIEATWIGGGTAPLYCPLTITSSAVARIEGMPHQSQYRALARNGVGALQKVWSGVSGVAEASSVGTLDATPLVVSGVATYTVEKVRCEVYGGTGAYLASCQINVTAAIQSAPTFDAEVSSVSVVVHHTLPDASTRKTFDTGTGSGSWNTASVGVDGGVAASSDGAATGAFSLLMQGADFATLFDTDKLTGVEVSFECRVIGAPGAANGTVKVHVGTIDAGNPATTFALPTTGAWQYYRIGDMHTRFGHESTWAESGTAYPNKTGADVKAEMALQIAGTNVSGVVYQFRNIRIRTYVVSVD